MSPFYFSLCNAVIVTVVLLVFKSKTDKESNTTFGVHVFFAVFIITFLVSTFLLDNSPGVNQEIDVGEPPF